MNDLNKELQKLNIGRWKNAQNRETSVWDGQDPLNPPWRENGAQEDANVYNGLIFGVLVYEFRVNGLGKTRASSVAAAGIANTVFSLGKQHLKARNGPRNVRSATDPRPEAVLYSDP